MNETFGYNTENLKKMIDDLRNQMGIFKQSVEEMFHGIDTTLNSSEYWQGQSYEQFKSTSTSYKVKTLDPLIQEINGLLTDLENTATLMDANTNKNLNLFS